MCSEGSGWQRRAARAELEKGDKGFGASASASQAALGAASFGWKEHCESSWSSLRRRRFSKRSRRFSSQTFPRLSKSKKPSARKPLEASLAESTRETEGEAEAGGEAGEAQECSSQPKKREKNTLRKEKTAGAERLRQAERLVAGQDCRSQCHSPPSELNGCGGVFSEARVMILAPSKCCLLPCVVCCDSSCRGAGLRHWAMSSKARSLELSLSALV